MLREEAIKKHRAMWNWIAEQIENEQKVINIGILKTKFLEMQGDDTTAMKLKCNCYLCYYTDSDCRNCPLIWPSESDLLRCEQGYQLPNGCYSEGLYKKCRTLDNRNHWKLQAILCRKIANLPERKMSNEKH